MHARTWLVVLPLALLVFMVQSVLWIPHQRDPTRSNPARSSAFVEASIGDARLLNPILHADVSSGRIVDLVFDGLLRIGDELELRPALAERWSLGERAYLLPDPSVGTPLQIATKLRESFAREPDMQRASVGVVGGYEEQRDIEPGGTDSNLRVRWPERVEIALERVEPDLIERVRKVLGHDYGARILRRDLIATDRSDLDPREPAQLDSIVPILEHNPELIFELREDVRFHDGHPLDADDVAFTYASIMDPRNLSPRRSSFEPIKRVEVLSPHRLRVIYKRLFSPAVDAWTIGILPRHLLDRSRLQVEMDRRGIVGDARERFSLRESEFNRNPVGTGPFRFVRWSSDELIRLARNADYWDGPPWYQDYFMRILPDTLTQEIEFRSGTLDVYQAEPHQAARYRRDARYRAFSSLGTGYTYVGYNLRREPFSDPAVRLALGLSVDVDSIIRYVLFGEGERTTGPFPGLTRWYDRSVRPIDYDPERARQLLAERGWSKNADGWLEKNGKRFEFNLITNHGNLRRKAIASILQGAWRRIGIKTNVQLFEWAVFLKDFINPGAFDAVVLGWRMGLDPDLHAIWHSSQTGPNQLNFVGLQDALVDELIGRIREEYDGARQESYAHALHRRIAELQPYTFLFTGRTTQLLDRRIVMRDADGTLQPVRPGGAGDLFFHMNRWQRLEHDPGR